jgi:Ca-activated chloride channel family protein
MRFALTALALTAAAAPAWAGDLVPTDPRYGPLRIALHRIETNVDNQVALTRVEQVFANDNPVQLEAHYVFPVPKGATIIDFSMTIDGKVMRGELLEKKRAREVYEGIVRQSRDPGLLEHVGANIFRVRVFPVLPRSEQKIELTYVERVSYDAGLCRWSYPLVTPGQKGTTKAGRFELRWRLTSFVPIQEIASPTHPLTVTRKTAEMAEATFEGRDVDLGKDLEIGYRIARAATGIDVATHRPKADEEGTFLLLITPEVKVEKPLPKDMTFVFDTSGSMSGPRIQQARAALRFCLSKLQPLDRFNILSFSGEVVAFSPAHVPATDAEKARAERFVDALDASGSTNINAALLRALDHRAAEGRPHLVVFLTDGEPTAGEIRPPEILKNVAAANRSNVRIFTFGVGDAINRGLLDDLAEATAAVAEHVDERENIEEKVSRLQKKIAAPVLTELAIDWGGAEAIAVHPKSPGDLYAGTQLMITGRYRKAGTFDVTLRGKAGARPVEVRQKVTFPEKSDDGQAIPYLWAMRKVAWLLDEIRRNGENREVVDEVVALSRRYRIATPYTSFLVLENEQAYDRHGIDRKGATWQPPGTLAKGDVPLPRATGKVFVPDVNETIDDEAFHKETSVLADSDKPFKGKGTYDGGGGGAGRLGRGRSLVARGGGGAVTEDAVLAALKWLSKNQKPDGSWDATEEDFRIGTTALSLLPFLGAGYSHLSKDTYDQVCFGDVVRKALQYLLSKQDPEGCIGPREAQKYMYGHAISALALSEAYGNTGSNLFKDQAQKAIDFLVAAQNPGKAWRYSARCGDNDTSVTAWAMMALKSAELSALTFPRSAYDGIRAWLKEVSDDSGRAGYTSKGAPGPDAAFDPHETLSAVSLLARILMDRDRVDARVAEFLARDLPEWKGTQIDFCYWFFASHALFQYDGPAGPRWKAWNEKLKAALVDNQVAAKGDTKGSWDPVDRWSPAAGRAYATALNAMTLEVYYRYPHVFLGGGRLFGGAPNRK